MEKITVDFSEKIGVIKPMHAVNNGPIVRGRCQWRHNFDTYKAAKIPYARNHDASYCASYGGEHTVDIHAVFPNFDADENDPESYDFLLTDEYLSNTLAAGTKIFYRLGTKIEHESKKYNTLPPKNFNKWARICEHIIRHYNEGWADGYNWNIEYWEIWNEADLVDDDSPYVEKLCWGGTKAQFFDFFRIAATHLKKCFPSLKIGGPAVSTWKHWAVDFLENMSEGERVPLDFFSWHTYCTNPKTISHNALEVREALDKYGYTETESILNEWNYVESWMERFIESIKTVIGIKGAAFVAASMCEGQNSPVDMLMYYDARPCIFNGMFDIYTLLPIKGYYPFLMFSRLYSLSQQVRVSYSDDSIFAVAANGNDGGGAILVCYYPLDENAEDKSIEILASGADISKYHTYLLDADHDCEDIGETTKLTLKPNSVVLLTDTAI